MSTTRIPATDEKTTQATAASRAEKGDSSARTVLPLSWTATEYGPQRRWWWFAVVGYIGLFASLIAVSQQTWSVAAVIIAGTIGLLVINAGKPRSWQVTLETATLTVDTRSYELANYRAFTIETTVPHKGERLRSFIVLLPKKRFGRALDIYLSGDDDADGVIAEVFQTVLPFDESPSYLLTQRVLDRLARWMRLI